MTKKILIFTFFALFFSSVALVSYADTAVFNSTTIQNPLGQAKTLTVLIGDLLQLVAQIGAVVCIFFIIYSGFLFIKAQGDPAELKTAKSVFLWSVVGTAVLLGASVVSDLIRGTVESLIGKPIN